MGAAGVALEVAPARLDPEPAAVETEDEFPGLAGGAAQGQGPDLEARGAVVRHEIEAVPGGRELLHVGGRGKGRDVLHHPRARRGAVALPELDAMPAVVGREE